MCPFVEARQGNHHKQPALSCSPCVHMPPACMQAETNIAAARITRSVWRVCSTLLESMGQRMALLLTWQTLHSLGRRHSQVRTTRSCSYVHSDFRLLSGCEPDVTCILMLPVSPGDHCTDCAGFIYCLHANAVPSVLRAYTALSPQVAF